MHFFSRLSSFSKCLLCTLNPYTPLAPQRCLRPCSVCKCCHSAPHTSLPLGLSVNPSVTADLRPLSAGPLLVVPSWRAVDRLGRGRRQCQLYWCRKGHTRQTGPVSAAAAAAACYPPGCRNHNTHTHTHTYAHIYITATTTHAHQHQRTNAKQAWSDWDLVNWDKTFVCTLGSCKQAHRQRFSRQDGQRWCRTHTKKQSMDFSAGAISRLLCHYF